MIWVFHSEQLREMWGPMVWILLNPRDKGAKLGLGSQFRSFWILPGVWKLLLFTEKQELAFRQSPSHFKILHFKCLIPNTGSIKRAPWPLWIWIFTYIHQSAPWIRSKWRVGKSDSNMMRWEVSQWEEYKVHRDDGKSAFHVKIKHEVQEVS